MLQQTGAAILVLRGIELLPAAPAAELRCCGARLDRVPQVFRCNMLFIMVRELLCAYCKHLQPHPERRGPLICAAFPNGIHKEIVNGEVLHYEPYPSDNGIQFESEYVEPSNSSSQPNNSGQS